MLDVKRLQVLLSVVELGSVTAAADALVYTRRRCRSSCVGWSARWVSRCCAGTPAGCRRPTPAWCSRRTPAWCSASCLRPRRTWPRSPGCARAGWRWARSPTVASSFLPLAVHRFSELHPAIRLDIRSERQPQLIEWLENGTVDLSLLWDYRVAAPRLGPARPDRAVLRSHRAAGVLRAPVGPSAAGGHGRSCRGELGRPAGPPVVEVLQRAAVAAGFEPKISFRANDYQEAQAMVGIGFGVALAPQTAVLNRLPNVRVISLRHQRRRPPGTRRAPPGPGRLPAEAAFHKLLVEIGGGYQPE